VLRAVIEAAHARGLRVTGHLCSVTFPEAAAMGIDALQHGFITDSDHVPGKEPDACPPENMRVQADVDVSSRGGGEHPPIVEHGAAVVSTLGVYETFVPGRARLDPRAMEMLDPARAGRSRRTHAAARRSAVRGARAAAGEDDAVGAGVRRGRRAAGRGLGPVGHRVPPRLRQPAQLRAAGGGGLRAGGGDPASSR
jgi:hypothetical protein